MPHLLIAALCLVMVMEGLFLFAAPRTWQRMAEQMRNLEARQLRVIGAILMAIGLIFLRLVV